jgi:hypothetical protein
MPRDRQLGAKPIADQNKRGHYDCVSRPGALTAQDVHRWFVSSCARGKVPDEQKLHTFAAHLNRLSAYRLGVELKTPSEILVYRASVQELRRSISPIIKRAEQVFKNYRAEYDASEYTTAFHEERLAFEEKRLERLNNLKRALDDEPMGTPYVSKTPAWHGTAQSVAWFVNVAFRGCGRRADFQTASSPAIKVVVQALAHLGLNEMFEDGELKAETVVKALRESHRVYAERSLKLQ